MVETNITAWSWISQEPRVPQGVLTDSFVQRFDRNMDWDILSLHYFFTVEMLRIYFHRINWIHLLQRQQFSEDLLTEMAANFDCCWEVISKHQNLSENYIEKFKDKLDWEIIFEHQKMSGKFLKEHSNYLPFLYFNKNDNDTGTITEKSGTAKVTSITSALYFYYFYSLCLLVHSPLLYLFEMYIEYICS